VERLVSRILPLTVTVDEGVAHAWALGAAQAAVRVPASGTEAVNWAVRGWAEVALGCAVGGVPDAFRGLDDAVRASDVPCGGPFADRVRALRSRGGEVPAWYFGADARHPTESGMDAGTVEACLNLAEFCDSLSAAISALRRDRARREREPPPWTGPADHLRWGERLRPRTRNYRYEVLHTTIEQNLAWRSWLCLPTMDGPRIALVDPARTAPVASVRQRVCHGIHNGAHLDHLGALAGANRDPAGSPAHAPIEFGAGLLVAESFAMAVELLAAAECVLAGLPAEAHQLLRGFVERIGRVPGYRAWHERTGRGCGSAALDAAASIKIREFATLPTLAANYVTGPLRLLANESGDPLLPSVLHKRLRQRWAAVSARFPAAAVLASRPVPSLRSA
jgi:hypothetical protein